MTDINKSEIVGANIKFLRTNAGLSQKEFARMIDKKLSSVQKYESGAISPPISVLHDIAYEFRIPLPYLLYETDKLKKEVEKIETIKSNAYTGKETVFLTDDETNLIINYQRLNDLGKEEANKRVEELTEIPRYTDKED